MTTSEIVRAAIIVILVIVLVLRKRGFAASLKERREKKRQQEEKLQQAELRKDRKKRAVQQVEQKKQQTAELLRSTLAGGLQSKVAAVAGQEVHYFEGGRGTGQTVLLLHGFASTKEDWVRFARSLLHEGFRVVAPDLPGFGQNRKDPEVPYDVTTQTKRIRALTQKLGLKGLHVVGSSLGGSIAAAYTYAFPQDVLTMTLIEPLGVRVPYPSELDEMEQQGRNPLTIAVPDAYENLLGFLFVEVPPMKESFKRLRAEDAARHREFYLKMWREIRTGDKAHLLDSLLPAIEKRTLVLQGEKSRVVHPSTADMIKQCVKAPGLTRTVVMEGCGHLPAVEKPEAAAGEFLRFVEAAT